MNLLSSGIGMAMLGIILIVGSVVAPFFSERIPVVPIFKCGTVIALMGSLIATLTLLAGAV